MLKKPLMLKQLKHDVTHIYSSLQLAKSDKYREGMFTDWTDPLNESVLKRFNKQG